MRLSPIYRDRGRCLVSAISVAPVSVAPFFVAAVGKNPHVSGPGVDGPVRTLVGACEGDGMFFADDSAHVYVAATGTPASTKRTAETETEGVPFRNLPISRDGGAQVWQEN